MKLKKRTKMGLPLLLSWVFLMGLGVGITGGSQAQASVSSDFQIDDGKLVKYTGTDSTVVVPDEVKIIGVEAFAGNKSLAAISLGEQVKEIEYGAFRDCSLLTVVNLPESLESIGRGAFSNNVSLQRIILKQKVRTIGSGAFAGCRSLAKIGLDSGNPYFAVDSVALYNQSMTKLYCYFQGREADSYAMPSTVEKIDDYAFWGNEDLKEIVLSSSLAEVSAYAFSNCKALQKIVIPYSVNSIDAKAFENCTALEEADIPSSVAYIHSTAFDGCPLLTIVADEGSKAADYYETWKAAQESQAVPGEFSVSGNDGLNEEEQAQPEEADGADGGSQVTVSGNAKEVSQEGDESSQVYEVGSGGQVKALPSSSTASTADPLEAEEGVLSKSYVVGQNAVLVMEKEPTVRKGGSEQE